MYFNKILKYLYSGNNYMLIIVSGSVFWFVMSIDYWCWKETSQRDFALLGLDNL